MKIFTHHLKDLVRSCKVISSPHQAPAKILGDPSASWKDPAGSCGDPSQYCQKDPLFEVFSDTTCKMGACKKWT